MQWYKVSSVMGVVEIAVENGIIRGIEPILHEFVGQHYSALTKKMKESGYVRMDTIFVGIGEIRAGLLKKYVQWEDYKVVKEGDETLEQYRKRVKHE